MLTPDPPEHTSEELIAMARARGDIIRNTEREAWLPNDPIQWNGAIGCYTHPCASCTMPVPMENDGEGGLEPIEGVRDVADYYHRRCWEALPEAGA